MRLFICQCCRRDGEMTDIASQYRSYDYYSVSSLIGLAFDQGLRRQELFKNTPLAWTLSSARADRAQVKSQALRVGDFWARLEEFMCKSL